MKNTTLKLSFVAGAAALVFSMAGACGDELIDDSPCLADADCTDPLNPTCQPFTGECGTLDCTAAADCTVCSDIGGACVLPCTDSSSTTDARVKLQCPAGQCGVDGNCATDCTEDTSIGMSGGICTGTQICLGDGSLERGK